MLGWLVNRHLATVLADYPWGDALSVLRTADAVVINLGWVLADRDEPWLESVFTLVPRKVRIRCQADETKLILAEAPEEF